MKIYGYINRFLTAAAMPALLLGAAACQDEIENPIPDYTLSDVPTTISVKLDIPGLSPVSRADLSEKQLNQVNSVWIRTYSATTGEHTSDWAVYPVDHKDEHVLHGPVTLNSRSGYSYIVAVANVDNLGVTVDEKGNVSDPQPISTLLKDADTWDQFRAISVASPVTNQEIFQGVTATQQTLVMSGCYTSLKDKDPENWEKESYSPVFIPAVESGTHNMGGAIHLRRLVSHITFKLKPGPNVTITPQSFTVANAPKYTWLYERKRTDNESYLNTGDYCNEGNKDDYYVTPEQFSNQNIRQGAGDDAGTYIFDFWQGENKHQGLATCKTYNDRELEQKTAITDPTDGGPTEENTGLYTSLTGDTWTKNNMASYVIVRCNVRYTTPQTDVDGNQPYTEGTGVYTIHLGYCEGKGEALAQDFNCRRNVNYTYNVTVNGINSIYVEATRDLEEEPGAEGIVSFIDNDPIDLDCHYGAFNVQFSEAELNKETFGFIVQTFYNGQERIIDENDIVSDDDMKFINWIEFRPTTGQYAIADYKPRTGDNETFNLLDIRSGLTADQKSETGWYTVFVNEYVYEKGPDESESKGGWRKYVNQDARRFYLRVVQDQSPDGQSIYAKAKYAVSQRSIQSYYSTEESKQTQGSGDIPNATAIGAEHVNEMRGMNMQLSFSSTGFDNANGRYNVWLWLNDVTDNDRDSYTGNASKQWKEVLKSSTQQYIPAVNDKQGYRAAAKYVNLPAAADFNGTTYTNTTLDPQTSAFVEAINACMNRNRDLNGDGQIQPEEVRWYVPAVGKYLRLILGRNSLQNPIMDYANTPNIINSDEDNGYATRYLMYASNNRVVWAMEGLATSNWSTGGWRKWLNDYNYVDYPGMPQYCYGSPWEVRCIRNLGSNLSTVTKGEKVTAAYTVDRTNRIVRMSYYDMNSVRTEKFTDEMPVHTIADQRYNRCYYAFEYSELSRWQTNNGTTTGDDLIKGAKPCSGLNVNGETGWRVPNQKELAILLNIKEPNSENTFLNFTGVSYYLSCTIAFYAPDGEGYTGNGAANSWGERRFMGIRSDAGSQVKQNETGAIRCVRDVDP